MGRERGAILKRSCAWCKASLDSAHALDSELGEESHGICLECLSKTFEVPVVSIASLSQADLDRLPYGVIILDRAGRVVAFNSHEVQRSKLIQRDTMGRDFFLDIAPCMNVKEVGHWVSSARAAGVSVSKQIDFVLQFARSSEYIDLSIRFDAPTGLTTLVLRSVS